MPYRFVEEPTARYQFVETPREKFEKQQLKLGTKPEEIAAEVGGLHAPPPPVGGTAFNIVRGIADPLLLSDPILAIPEFAALGTAPGIARGAMAMGAFGGLRGAEEAERRGGGLADIAKGAGRGAFTGALTGAVLGPAMAPRATYTAGILAPLGLGGALGFLEAPKGEGLEGALKGAGTFAAMKAGMRGIGGALEMAGRGTQAVRNLFGRGRQPGAPSPVDAPAGLTDEILGEAPLARSLRELRETVTTQRGQAAAEFGAFERFYEGKLPPEELLQRNIARSTAEAEQFIAEKGRLPIGGPPALSLEPRGAPTGPVIPIQPPAVHIAEPPIRMGPPRVPGLPVPPSEWKGIAAILRQRIRQAGDLSPEETGQLKVWAADETTPANVRGLASRLLDIGAPGAPIEMGGPVFGQIPPGLLREGRKGAGLKAAQPSASQQQAEAGDIVSAISDITANRGVKFGKDVRSDVRQSLISSGLPKNIFNYKSGTPVGDVVEALNARGFPMTTETELIEALRARSATGKVAMPTAREEAEGTALAGIREDTNTANLFERLRQIKDPNSPEGLAIMRRLNELGVPIPVPAAVVKASSITDPTLKQVTEFMWGKIPTYTKEQIEFAEAQAKLMRPSAEPPPAPGTEADQIVRAQVIARAKATPNPNPADDLNAIKQSGAIEEAAGIEPIPGPRGGVDIPGGPGNAPVNSFNVDFNNYWDRVKSFFGIEVKGQFEKLARRVFTAQELARQHPEFDPIYQQYHAYPRRAANRHVANLTPLVKQVGPNGQPVPSYLDLPAQQRQGVDKFLKWQKDNRQGQAPVSDSELQLSRSFTPDMVRASHDVLDVGKRILQAHRDDYVNSRLGAMMEAGVPQQVARAQLEVEAAAMFRGMDHWVPDSRFGTKVAAAYDPGGNLLEFRLTPNVKERVSAVNEMKATYPNARIDEGLLEQFVREKAFDEIDLASLGILSQRARVDPEVRQEFMNQLKPYLLKRSDALARFKKYEGVKGSEEDLRRPLISASSSTFNYLERKAAYREATKALGEINPREKPEMFKFASQYIDDNMRPGDKSIRAVRDLAYTYALGGQLRQWPVQLTQFPTVVVPELLKFGTPGQVAQAAGTGMRWAFGNLKKAPQELQDAFLAAYKEGVFQPRSEMFVGPMFEHRAIPFKEAQIEERLAAELRQFETPATRHIQQARDFLMLPITDADMRTRIGAFASFYDMGRRFKGMNPGEATQFGIDEANRTNFLYGRAESPQLFGRGNLALFANMLKNWPAAYTSYLRGVYNEANREAILAGGTGLASRLGKMGQAAVSGPSPARAFASSVGAMAALGGALYNIPSPLRAAFAAGLGVDPETEMRKLLSGKLGLPDMATEVALRGVGAIAGVDISRSLALGDILPTGSPSDIVPALGMATTIGKGVGELYKSATQPFGPDVMDTLERMSGGGLKSAFKAARLASEGIATRRGGQLPGGEEIGIPQIAMQAAGFTPLEVAKSQALQRATQAEITRHKEIQSNMIEQLATAAHRGNNDQMQTIIAKVRANNQDAMAKGRPDLLITVSEQAIRQRVAEMISSKASLKRVPKVMQRRALELEQTYLGGPPASPVE